MAAHLDAFDEAGSVTSTDLAFEETSSEEAFSGPPSTDALEASFDEPADDDEDEDDWTTASAGSGLNALVRIVAAQAAARNSFVESDSSGSSGGGDDESDASTAEFDEDAEDEDAFERSSAGGAPVVIRAASPARFHAAAAPSGSLEASVESEVCCPITHMLMLDPVLASDGVVYERYAIERWIALALSRGARRAASPVTRARLRRNALRPVPNLRRLAALLAESDRVDAPLRDDYAERYLARAVRRRDVPDIVRARASFGGGRWSAAALCARLRASASTDLCFSLKVALLRDAGRPDARRDLARAVAALQRSFRADRPRPTRAPKGPRY